MKKLVALLLALVAVMSLAGCQSAEEETVLTILTSDDTSEGGALKAMAEKYTEETGIATEFVEVPYDDMESKLLNMIKADNAPAVVKYASYAAYSDYLLDITDIAPSADDMYLTTSIDGEHTIALAANVSANGMFINKTLFDEAGITVPTGADDLWTWDEFLAAIQTVVDTTEAEYGLVVDHSQQRYSTILFQYGGALYNQDLTKVLVNSEESMNALNMFLGLFESGLSPKSTWVGSEDPSAMFKTGKIAAHLSGNWKLADYTENITDFEWVPVLMPYEEQRSTVFGGNYIYAIDGSGVEEEAKAFLKWFYTAENYAEYCRIGGYLPGQSGVEPVYDMEGMDIFVDELAASPAIAKTYEKIFVAYPDVDWGNVLRDSIDSAIAGDMTAEEVLETSEKAILDTYEAMSVE